MIPQLRNAADNLQQIVLSIFSISAPCYLGYVIWLNRMFFNTIVLISLVFVWCLAIVLAFSGTCFLIARMHLKYKEYALLNQSRLIDLERINTEKAIYDATVKQLESKQIFLTEQKTSAGLVKFKNFPKHAKLGMNSAGVLQELSLDEPELKNSLLTDLVDCQRLLITGGSGSGKTSLLLHIAQKRAEIGELIILDPDGKIGKWGKYHAIGQGDNFDAIKSELIRINGIFKERAVQYANGVIDEREFPLITIIADEWHEISRNIPGIIDLIKPILTRGRKYCLDVSISGNSKTVKNLGIEGEGDLIHNFEAVLHLNKIKNERLVFVDFGDGEVIYNHPGAFIVNSHSQPIVKSDIVLSADFTNALNKIMETPLIMTDEEKILQAYNELVESGKTEISKNDIAKKAFKYSKSNGRIGPIITATLQNMPFFQ